MARVADAPPARVITTDAQLMQEYLQSAGILIDASSARPVASLLDPAGESEAIVIDASGSLFHVCREPLSDSGWNMYGLGAGFSRIAAVDDTTLWAIDLSGALWQNVRGRWTQVAQTLPSGQTPSEVSIGIDGTLWALDYTGALYEKCAAATQTPPAFSATVPPAALRDANGLLRVFCIDTSGELWTIAHVDTNGQWSAWSSLGAPTGTTLRTLAVCANQDGRLQVFAIGADQNLYTVWELRPNAAWSAWGILAPQGAVSALTSVTAGRNANGCMEVFALAADHTVRCIAQTAPNNGWGSWASLGAPSWAAPVAPAVGQNADGRLELFVLDPDSFAVWHIWQTAPGGVWSEWNTLSALPPSKVPPTMLAVAANANGMLQVFFGGTISLMVQVPCIFSITQNANGGWYDWMALNGAVGSGQPTAALNAQQNLDGRIELFVLDTAGSLWHTWQVAANGSTWGSAVLPAPSSASLQCFVAARDGEGRLNVFAAGTAGTQPDLWQIQQTSAGGQWSGWNAGWWGWSLLQAPALKHAPSGSSSQCWAVATNGTLAHSSGGAWASVSLPASQTAAWVAVGADGTTWALSSSGTLYQYANGVFAALPGTLGGVAFFSASGADALWATAAIDAAEPQDYALYRYSAGAWTAVDTPPLYGGWNPPQVSVGRDGSVWMLSGSGTAWQQTRAGLERWPVKSAPAGTPQFVSLSGGPIGSVWCVDATGAIWRFTGTWSAFPTALPGGAVAAQVASPASGTLYAIDTSGNPFQYSSTQQQWQPVAGLPQLVQAPTGWAVGKNGTIWQFANNTWATLGSGLPNGATPVQVVQGVDRSVWALDVRGALYRFANAVWQPVDGIPSGLVQIAAVNAGALWGLTRSASGAFTLYAYNGSSWQLTAGAPLLSQLSVAPQISAGADGTVWLLDGSGNVRVVGWNSAPETWSAKKLGVALRTIASAGVGDAWAVDAGGMFWRNADGRWIDAQAPLPRGVAATDVSVDGDGSVWALDANGILYAYGAPQTPLLPPLASAVPPVTCRDAQGVLWLFCADQSGALWACRWNASSSWWSGLMQLGTAPGGDLQALAATLSADGVLHVFATAQSVYEMRQQAAGGGWGVWNDLASPAGVSIDSVAVGANQDGRLQLFAIGSDRNLHTLWETAPNVWSAWGSVNPAAETLTSVTVASNSLGCMNVVALGADGSVQSIVQTAPNNGWSVWTPLGAPAGLSVRSLALGANQDGRLQVFAIGSDANLYSRWETAPNVWSGWSVLNATPIQLSELAAGQNADGCLLVAGIGADQTLHVIAQEASNGNWSNWSSLGAPATGAAVAGLALGENSDGDAAVFAFSGGSATALWSLVQGEAWDTGWSNWLPLAQTQPAYWSAVAGAPALRQALAGPDSSGLWWSVNGAGALVTFDGKAWTTPSASGMPTGVSSITVGSDGGVRAINAGACYAYAAGVWRQTIAGSFVQAPQGSAGALWNVTASGGVVRSTDGGTTWWPDANFDGSAARIAVGADSTVWMLDATGAAYENAAWQRIMRPTGVAGWPDTAQSTSVVAGTDERGVRYVFYCTQEGKLAYSYEVFRHTWVEPLLLETPSLTTLALTNQQDSGELIVYGLAASGSLATVATKAPNSDGYMFAVQSSPIQVQNRPVQQLADVELCAIGSGFWCWFGIWNGGGATLVAAVGGPGAPLTFGQIPSSPGSLASFVHSPWPRSTAAPDAIVMDVNRNLQVVALTQPQVGMWEYIASFLPLTGQGTALTTGVADAVAQWQAESGAPAQPRLYAMGAANALWVLRRIDASVPSTQPAAWSNWVPLGGDYALLAPGPALQSSDTLFAVDSADDSLNAVSQEPVAGRWTSAEVTRPSQSGDEIIAVPMYQTEITVTDMGGVPQVGVPVSISAATPTAIWVEGAMYRADANQSLSVPANAAGQLRIQAMADGLHTPALQFSVDGMEAGSVSVYPPQNVHDFLGCKGWLAVNGGQPIQFTSDNLVNATVGSGANSKPLSPGLSQATATQTVNWSQQIAAMPNGASAARASVAGWAMELSDPAHPVIRTFATGDALAAYRRQLDQRRPQSAPLGSFWHHIWHGIKHAADDVVHAIEKGVATVETITVDVENQVVHLSLTIAGSIVDTFDLVVHSVEDALHAIEAILHTLVADIKEVIQWLMMLLDWADIWHTKQVLEAIIAQSMQTLQSEMGTIQTKTQGIFASLESDIKKTFSTALADFPFATFRDLPTNTGAGRVGALPGAASIPAVSSVHQNWMLSKTTRNVTPGTSYGTSGLSSPDLAGVFLAKDIVGLLQQAGTDFLAYLKALCTDPKDFLDLTIVEFLEQAENLVIGLIKVLDDLAQAFLATMELALQNFDGAFNQRLDIPLVSKLYEFLFDEDLTVLHLATLLMAIPLTILYKLLNKGEAPFSGVDPAALRARASLARTARSRNGLTLAAPELNLPISAQQWKDIYLAVGMFNAIVVGVGDGITIAQGPEGTELQGLNVVGRLVTLLSDFSVVIMQVSSWPPSIGTFPNVDLSSDMSAADAAALANWVSYWFQPCWDINTITMGDPNYDPDDDPPPDPSKKPYSPEVVDGISTAIGLVNMVTAVVAIAIGKHANPPLNGVGVAQDAIGPFGSLMSWIMLPEVRGSFFAATDELGYGLDLGWAKLGIDAGVNVSEPILNYLS